MRDATIFVVNLPTIRGLSQFGGIDMYLQARAGQSRDELQQARNILLGAASQNKALVGIRPNTLEDAPLLQLKVDRTQAHESFWINSGPEKREVANVAMHLTP